VRVLIPAGLQSSAGFQVVTCGRAEKGIEQNPYANSAIQIFLEQMDQRVDGLKALQN